MKRQKNYPLYDIAYFSTIKEMITLAEKQAGDKIAFKYKTEKENIVCVTYSEFRSDTIALGCALTELGISCDHVACIGDNSYNWLVSFLTMLGSSGVFVPIDRELPPADIKNILNSSDSTAVFYSNSYDNIMDERKAIPGVKYFIGFDLEEDSADGVYLSFKKLLSRGYELAKIDAEPYMSQKSDPNALKLLVYTSGTTGMAKGVMLSEHNIVSCVYYGLQISTVYDVCLSVLPYHHTYESVCGILVSLHMHSTICINDKLRNVLKNLQLFKPSYIMLVPAFAETFYKKIWSTAKENKKDGALKKLIGVSNAMRNTGIDMRKKFFKSIHTNFGGNLRKIVCGGAPIRQEIGQFFDDIGITLVNGYGITECSPLVTANRDYFNDWSTTGVKLPCLDIKIENPTSDGNGEIMVKGDSVMLGYYKNEAATNAVLSPDGWFATGDYGNINELGQLTITGRKKNLIVLSNGKNIYPEEIENYLMAIPYVEEIIVYSLRDESGGEISLCAEAFLNEEKLKELKITDPNESLKRDITGMCRSLPSYKHIQKIVIRETEFDKTTSKKIKRSH